MNIQPDNFELIDRIGQGKHTVVWLGVNKITKDQVAIKCLNLNKLGPDMDITAIRKEYQMIRECDHENIVDFYGTYVSGAEIHMVMELFAGSVVDLMQWKQQVKYHDLRGIADERLISGILKSVVSAIVYLHDRNIIHRCVSAKNVFINSEGIVKLGDSGTATTISTTNAFKETITDQIYWLAPEIVHPPNRYGRAVDIWSIGIASIEFGKGLPPGYSQRSTATYPKFLILKEPPTLDDARGVTFSKEFKRFVKDCCKIEPQKRPAALELAKHKFLKQAAGSEEIKAYFIDSIPDVVTRYKALNSLILKEFNEEPAISENKRASMSLSKEWTFDSDESESDEEVDAVKIQEKKHKTANKKTLSPDNKRVSKKNLERRKSKRTNRNKIGRNVKEDDKIVCKLEALHSKRKKMLKIDPEMTIKDLLNMLNERNTFECEVTAIYQDEFEIDVEEQVSDFMVNNTFSAIVEDNDNSSSRDENISSTESKNSHTSISDEEHSFKEKNEDEEDEDEEEEIKEVGHESQSDEEIEDQDISSESSE